MHSLKYLWISLCVYIFNSGAVLPVYLSSVFMSMEAQDNYNLCRYIYNIIIIRMSICLGWGGGGRLTCNAQYAINVHTHVHVHIMQ